MGYSSLPVKKLKPARELNEAMLWSHLIEIDNITRRHRMKIGKEYPRLRAVIKKALRCYDNGLFKFTNRRIRQACIKAKNITAGYDFWNDKRKRRS